VNSASMARDIFCEREQCRYCSRPGVTQWDVELISCSREVCQALAFSELRRRNANRRDLPQPIALRALGHQASLGIGSARRIHVHGSAFRRVRAA
jgi:hypothetical protein